MTRRIHHFNTCQIDLSARELRRDGELVRISPRIFDCIAYLLEQRERAVGRDELMAAVWGKVDVADTQLGQAILKARRAVGDTGDEQNTIRTVPRFGYRWVAAVRIVDGDMPVDGSMATAEVDHMSVPLAADTVDGAQASDRSGTPSPSATDVDVPPGRGYAGAASSDGRTPDGARMSTDPPGVIVPSRFHRFVRPAVATVAMVLAVLVVAFWWGGVRGDRDSTTPADSATTLAPARAGNAAAILPAAIDADAEWSWLRLGLMEFVASRLRDAGQATLPSDNIVAVARAGMDAADMSAAVRRALDPQWTIQPSARKTDSGWSVSLVLEDREGGRREMEAQADDAIAAARLCADQLLGVLGRSARDPGASADQASDDSLNLRVDAALLVDDVDAAQALLDSAPAHLRDGDAIQLRYAQLDFAAGRLESARTRFDDLLSRPSVIADVVLVARSASGRGATYIRLGKTAQAETDFTQALTAIEHESMPAIAGLAYTGRAVSRALLGRFDEALLDFSQARIALQLAGDTLGLARVEMNEGALKGFRHQPSAALASFQVAERYFERFGAYDELMHARGNQIVAYGALLRPDDALRVVQSDTALGDRLASPSAARLWAFRRSEALVGVGRWSEARVLLETLSTSVDVDAELDVAAMTTAALARIELDSGRFEPALALAGRYIDRLTFPDVAATRSELWLTRVRALLGLKRHGEAETQVRAFGQWAKSTGEPVIGMRAGLASAERLSAVGRESAARDIYERLLRDANARGVPGDIADVAIPYGGMLLDHGDVQAATSVIGQVARFASSDFGSALLQLRLYHALDQQEAWRRALASTRQLAGERPVPASLLNLGSAASTSAERTAMSALR